MIVEFFAGIGGWSEGFRYFGANTCYLIKRDEMTVKACAARFGTHVLRLEEFFSKVFCNIVQKHTVVLADINDPIVWAAMGLLNCGIDMASLPY